MAYEHTKLLNLTQQDVFNIRIILAQWIAENQDNPNLPGVVETARRVDAVEGLPRPKPPLGKGTNGQLHA